MEKTKKDMAVIDVPRKDITTINHYDRVIEMAMDSADLEKIEKFMDLKERHEKNEARKLYHLAMSKFKTNPPEIEKDSNVNYTSPKGVTSYNHATLGNVATKINKALGEHELSAGWKTDQGDNGIIKVTCTITHSAGYSESTSLHSMPDSSGGKNSIQAIGSTVTYLQRYTILALTGLATKEQDNDAQSVEHELITESQEADLKAMIEEKKIDMPKFLKHFNVTKLSEVWASTYPSCVQMVEAKK